MLKLNKAAHLVFFIGPQGQYLINVFYWSLLISTGLGPVLVSIPVPEHVEMGKIFGYLVPTVSQYYIIWIIIQNKMYFNFQLKNVGYCN